MKERHDLRALRCQECLDERISRDCCGAGGEVRCEVCDGSGLIVEPPTEDEPER